MWLKPLVAVIAIAVSTTFSSNAPDTRLRTDTQLPKTTSSQYETCMQVYRNRVLEQKNIYTQLTMQIVREKYSVTTIEVVEENKKSEPAFVVEDEIFRFTYEGVDCQITQTEFEMICATAIAETGDYDSYATELVIDTILNRYISTGTCWVGQSVYEILTAENQYASVENYYNPWCPTTNHIRKVLLNVMDKGEDQTNGAVFYYSPANMGTSRSQQEITSWFESLDFTMEYGGHRFFAIGE